VGAGTKRGAAAPDPAWHALAPSFGIPGNIWESPRTHKTLKNVCKCKSANDMKALGTASQAYDEGSIPFTRSMISIA
jgi:hypothetical protein